MHEMVPGKRFDRYHELGQHAFGKKLGLWVVVPLQLKGEVGVNRVYTITGGKCLKKFHDTLLYHSLGSFCTQGVQPDVQYRNRDSTAGRAVFRFSALGDVAFAFAGRNVALEIQATIPSAPKEPSKKPRWQGGVIAYIIVALCYLPVSLIGYGFLATMPKTTVPQCEAFLVMKMNFKPTKILLFLIRIGYVALIMFLAMTFPFFGGLLTFFGGFAFAPTTHFLPCIMWLAICKPKKKISFSWFSNWICIFLGVMLMIFAPIVASRHIILQAKTNNFTHEHLHDVLLAPQKELS
ncbi:Amino acid transporter, transmembrane domain [Dillenia turbinata]|uniref:Amino acid transporter, transmembrane domain n=1 Tax=Dillenia turbinata TaxID=194707 RepID=A0AAN8UWS9_9MAGN